MTRLVPLRYMLFVALGAFLAGRSTLFIPTLAAFVKGGIPDKKGLIHACYKTNTGALRVIDPSRSKCASDETRLAWHSNGGAAPRTTPPATPAPAYTRIAGTFTLPENYACTTPDPDTYNFDLPGPYNPSPQAIYYLCVVRSIPMANRPVEMNLIGQGSQCDATAGGAWVNADTITVTSHYSCSNYLLYWKDGELKLALENAAQRAPCRNGASSTLPAYPGYCTYLRHVPPEPADPYVAQYDAVYPTRPLP